jgi:DNA-binding response OmpR family regulator
VLVVARADEASGALVLALAGDGLEVHLADDAPAAEELGRRLAPDVVVVDGALVEPAAIGRLACRHLVVALVADESGSSAVLDAGADAAVLGADVERVAAQVRSLLRRARRLGTLVRRLGEVVVDLERAELRAGADVVPLTSIEGGLLAELLAAAGRPVSKAELLAAVWDGDAYDPNLVEVHVSHLRRKLRRCGDPAIETVRGLGYVLRLPPDLPPGTSRRGAAARGSRPV